jgi:hypothetical protein
VVAIGTGLDDVWEVFQFSEALLQADGSFGLKTLLRGQAGTEVLIPDFWPVGSKVVVMNGVPEQIDLALSARDLARHYRVGPAQRPLSDASYLHEIRAFSGVGLRPYAPCHLRSNPGVSGDLSFSWVRRTRIDGDSWSSVDVPLGEASEAYVLRVFHGAVMVREVNLSAPMWTYLAAEQAVDGVGGPCRVEVAQISQRFGAGLFARIDINV